MAAKRVMVFSNASLVIILEGVSRFSTSFITARPDALAENRRILVLEGIRLPPGSIIPRASHSAPMVLAVPKNGHTPGPV